MHRDVNGIRERRHWSHSVRHLHCGGLSDHVRSVSRSGDCVEFVGGRQSLPDGRPALPRAALLSPHHFAAARSGARAPFEIVVLDDKRCGTAASGQKNKFCDGDDDFRRLRICLRNCQCAGRRGESGRVNVVAAATGPRGEEGSGYRQVEHSDFHLPAPLPVHVAKKSAVRSSWVRRASGAVVLEVFGRRALGWTRAGLLVGSGSSAEGPGSFGVASTTRERDDAAAAFRIAHQAGAAVHVVVAQLRREVNAWSARPVRKRRFRVVLGQAHASGAARAETRVDVSFVAAVVTATAVAAIRVVPALTAILVVGRREGHALEAFLLHVISSWHAADVRRATLERVLAFNGARRLALGSLGVARQASAARLRLTGLVFHGTGRAERHVLFLAVDGLRDAHESVAALVRVIRFGEIAHLPVAGRALQYIGYNAGTATRSVAAVVVVDGTDPFVVAATTGFAPEVFVAATAETFRRLAITVGNFLARLTDFVIDFTVVDATILWFTLGRGAAVVESHAPLARSIFVQLAREALLGTRGSDALVFSVDVVVDAAAVVAVCRLAVSIGSSACASFSLARHATLAFTDFLALQRRATLFSRAA